MYETDSSSKANHSVSEQARDQRKSGQGLSTRGLVLIGIGGIIGAGFFLGCGLPIHFAGPAVLLAFLVGGLITAQVTGALTSIAVNQPVSGAYQAYPQMYIGRFAGYMQGWTYYVTSILTISSEAVAMAVFAKMWLPHTPTILLAGVFSALIVAINAFGVKSFERVESIMSVLKIGVLVGFIVYAVILLFAYLGHTTTWNGSWSQIAASGNAMHGWMPNGFGGLGQSMLIVVFAYAGIGVFASATSDIKEPRSIDKAAIWTVLSLAILYIGSIALVLWFVPWNHVNTSQSPFVYALTASGGGEFAMVLNGVILIAAFSVMAGALYSANQILTRLGQTGEAPHLVTKATKTGTPLIALVISTVGIAVALVVSVVLPANVYSFLVSASSYFTFFNWFLILWEFLIWRKRARTKDSFTSRLAFGQPVSTFITMVLLVALGAYALLQHDQRMGFYAALAISVLLCVAYLVVGRRSVR